MKVSDQTMTIKPKSFGAQKMHQSKTFLKKIQWTNVPNSLFITSISSVCIFERRYLDFKGAFVLGCIISCSFGMLFGLLALFIASKYFWFYY